MCTQDNVKPFDELSREEKIALFTAWVDGKAIEHYAAFSGKWLPLEFNFCSYSAVWIRTSRYRIKPQEPDYVNWEMIDEEYEWYARGKNESAYVYRNEPFKKAELFCGDGYHAPLFKSLYKNNGCNWQDSLQQRPKKGDC